MVEVSNFWEVGETRSMTHRSDMYTYSGFTKPQTQGTRGLGVFGGVEELKSTSEGKWPGVPVDLFGVETLEVLIVG